MFQRSRTKFQCSKRVQQPICHRRLRNQSSEDGSETAVPKKLQNQCSKEGSETDGPKKTRNPMVQGAESRASKIVKKPMFPKRFRKPCSKEGSETNVLKGDRKPRYRQRLRNLCSQTVQKPGRQLGICETFKAPGEKWCETRSFIKRRHSPFMANVHSMNPSSKCI